jgi:hypothetical protein
MPRRYGYLDPSCPLDWAHPTNVGLLADWTVSPLSGWRGGATLRDLVRGKRRVNDGALASGVTWGGGVARNGGYGCTTYDNNSAHRIDVPNATRLQLTSKGSLFCMFRLAAFPGTTFQGMIDKYGSVNGDGYSLHWHSGNEAVSGEIYNGGNQGGGAGTNSITTGVTSVSDITRWHDVLFTWDGSNLTIYLDGRQRTTNSQTLNALAGTKVVTIGACVAQTKGFNGNLDCPMIWNRALGLSEYRSLREELRRGNPNRWRWLRQVAYSLLVVAGGNTYNVSVSESATATDSVSAVAIFASSTSESATATDAVTAVAVLASTVSETAAASDACSAAAVLAASCSEAAVATDSVTCAAVFAAAVSEAAAATDVVSCAAVFVTSLTESATATDTYSTGVSAIPYSLVLPTTLRTSLVLATTRRDTVSLATTLRTTLSLPTVLE